MAGIFFIFSICILKSLARLPSNKGLVVMQSINATIQHVPFFAVFFVCGALCVWALIRALTQRNHPTAPYLIAGALLYLLGGVLVTILFDVPLNDAIDAAKPDENGAKIWANYLVV